VIAPEPLRPRPALAAALVLVEELDHVTLFADRVVVGSVGLALGVRQATAVSELAGLQVLTSAGDLPRLAAHEPIRVGEPPFAAGVSATREVRDGCGDAGFVFATARS